MKIIETKWIDLGDFGQHQAEIEAVVMTDFPHIVSLTVTVKGEEIQLAKLLPRDHEQLLLEEIEIDARAGLREQAEDREIDEYMERQAERDERCAA